MPIQPKRQGAAGTLKAEVASLKRQRILDVATRLFSERGYHGCSMDHIADELGASKQVIYYLFADKADVLASICRAGAELSLSAISDALARSGSTRDRMIWFCERLTTIVIDCGDFLSVYTREIGNLREIDRAEIMRTRGQIDRSVARLISEGVAAGEFDVADPLIAARAITGMISFMPQWLRPPARGDYPGLVQTMTDIAMRTLAMRTLALRPPAPTTKGS
jgi:TetR/AcrR family transcriptional regulator, cholesterol catabolism regulator